MSSDLEGLKAALADAATQLEVAAAKAAEARQIARRAREIISRVYASVNTPALSEVIAQVHNGGQACTTATLGYTNAADWTRSIAGRLGN